jgi:hypothetical protein
MLHHTVESLCVLVLYQTVESLLRTFMSQRRMTRCYFNAVQYAVTAPLVALCVSTLFIVVFPHQFPRVAVISHSALMCSYCCFVAYCKTTLCIAGASNRHTATAGMAQQLIRALLYGQYFMECWSYTVYNTLQHHDNSIL